MVMADRESVDVVVENIDLDENESDQQHQHHHECGHNSNLVSLHSGCMVNEGHYHPWDQEHIVYVPMIPFGDTSTRAGACIQVAGLQPVAPPDVEPAEAPPSQADDHTAMQVQPDDKAATAGHENNQQESSQVLVAAAGTRESHNEIERKRRLRIKQCCDILRRLIPGLNEKTDKATVLEHAVDYVDHLIKCPNHKCVCYEKK